MRCPFIYILRLICFLGIFIGWLLAIVHEALATFVRSVNKNLADDRDEIVRDFKLALRGKAFF
ncbi:MAG: hypothetical protein Q7U56_08810 [Humidesulfovibrio sp.]|nr:hypothetical protein [Humidesulfovibrio sp.]